MTTIDYEKFHKLPRLLLEADLHPLQGNRFQPTGFADLGPARYMLPGADGREMLLIESAQSVANRMELACWDEAADDLISELKGLPYVRIDCGEHGRTNTIREFHRLNSPYIWEGAETNSARQFREDFLRDLGIKMVRKKKGAKSGAEGESADVPGVIDLRKFYHAVFKWDSNSVLHGLFLEKVAGRLRMARLLSGFVEASDIQVAESGGTKVDHVLPSPKSLGLSADDGYGNVPFHRAEFTAKRITAYFNLDLALLRGYGLPENASKLLIALALFKIRRFLSAGLRLRTACDLEMVNGLKVTRPGEGFTVPQEEALLKDCEQLITDCNKEKLFAGVTDVKWEPLKKPTKKKTTESELEIDRSEEEQS